MGKHGWSLSTESVSFIRMIQLMPTDTVLLPRVHSRKAFVKTACDCDLCDWSVGDRQRSNASQETFPFPIQSDAISAGIQTVIWSSRTFSGGAVPSRNLCFVDFSPVARLGAGTFFKVPVCV
jgi:hypothetical protein